MAKTYKTFIWLKHLYGRRLGDNTGFMFYLHAGYINPYITGQYTYRNMYIYTTLYVRRFMHTNV